MFISAILTDLSVNSHTHLVEPMLDRGHGSLRRQKCLPSAGCPCIHSAEQNSLDMLATRFSTRTHREKTEKCSAIESLEFSRQEKQI